MIDLSACPISLDPSERQKLEELARQLPLIAELSACELFIDCVGDDGGVVVAHAWSNQLALNAFLKPVLTVSLETR